MGSIEIVSYELSFDRDTSIQVKRKLKKEQEILFCLVVKITSSIEDVNEHTEK
jgi:hypothetical protein